MSLTMLSLDSLILSKLNVRRTERDADIAALADDIAARGLKQNLVVVPAHFVTGETADGWDEKWEVIAGGRRFQAMQLLVTDGRLPADHPVPCLLEDRADASETSLSENLHKVAMNPADEFAAFHTIIEDREREYGDTRDAAIAVCAKRFGKPVSHIEGRLRLATLAPEILDALRADKIGVEAAKAYARTTDHDLQRKVFALHENDNWRGHKPAQIRSDLGGLTLPLDAPLANFVGLVTYQAEGGRIENEMFMGAEGQQRLTDIALLEKLAKKIAEAAIPALAKTDGFKSGLYAKGIGHSATLPKAPAGFERAWDYGNTPTKAQLKKSIAVYAIDQDGAALKRIARFKPAEAKPQSDHRKMTPEEQAALVRKRRIGEIAARLAVTACDDVVSRSAWPMSGWLQPFNEDHQSGDIKVAVLVRVTREEVEAQLEAAEAQYVADDAQEDEGDEAVDA